MKSKSISFVALAALFAASQATAQLVTVYPDDLGTSGSWAVSTAAGDGAATITGNQPRSGNGSLALTGSNGSAKLEITYVSDSPINFFLGTGSPLGLVSDLEALSFDWLRVDNPGASPQATPVFKLQLWTGSGGLGQTTYLTWEGAYNGLNKGNAAADTWHTASILDGNFWQQGNHNTGPYNESISDYSDWYVVGATVGFGSGWNGLTEMYIDNVTFDFGGTEALQFNFETTAISAVPEPSTYGAIGALVLLGLIMHRRRMRQAA